MVTESKQWQTINFAQEKAQQASVLTSKFHDSSMLTTVDTTLVQFD